MGVEKLSSVAAQPCLLGTTCVAYHPLGYALVSLFDWVTLFSFAYVPCPIC